MQAVTTQQLTKRFEMTTAVAGANLHIRPGELFTLLGPSGCGKSTLLRLLAGLERPDSGAIHFGDERVDGLPTHQRNIGMVFQSYAIFPHMSVAANVAYGLRARKLPEAEVEQRVVEALALVRMADFGGRRPEQLSGGQQQRVALARALATRPALLLMDEPLSNLDAQLRLAMREEIRRLQRQVGITTIYVTHDQEEALAISDRIGVMEGGRLLQVGSPQEIYSRPAHRAVAGFVGTCSFVAATVQGGAIHCAGVRLPGPAPVAPAGDSAVVVGLRPEALRPLAPDTEAPPGAVLLRGLVEAERFLGAFVSLQVQLQGGDQVTALSLRPPGTFRPGTAVALALDPAAPLLFDAETGEALR